MTRRITGPVILAWLVVGAAAWQTAVLFPYLNLDLTRQYLAVAALAGACELIAGTHPDGRPTFGGLSTGFAALLFAQLVWGPAPAVVIWAVATLASHGIANRGAPLRTTIFNAAQYTLAAAAAGRVWTALSSLLPPPPPMPAMVEQAAVFTAAYYLAGLVFLAVFHRDRPAYRRATYGWDLVTYLVTWPFGLVMAVMVRGTGLAGAALLFVPLLAVGFVLRLYGQAALAGRQAAVGRELAARLPAAREPDRAFGAVLAAAGKLVDFHTGLVFLWSDEGQCFRVEAGRGGFAGRLADFTLRRDGVLGAWLARERRPVFAADSRREPFLAGEGLAQLWRSLALFPLLAGDEVAGILVLGDKRPGAFAERDRVGLDVPAALAAAYAAAVLAERRRQDAGATDAVTGLYNRRYFLLRAGEESERAKRFGNEFAVALFALDSLGPVGERFGPAAARNMLASAAGILTATLRPVDLAARWGEAELAVLMPETAVEEAGGLVGDAADALKAYEFPLEEGTTVQMGLRAAWAVYPRNAGDLSGLLLRLEQVLARGGGRKEEG